MATTLDGRQWSGYITSRRSGFVGNASSSLAKDHIVVETNYVVTSDNLRK